MHNRLLLATVFVSGMLVMILELSGTRLIAPYFGSSTYTWSAMISVILGNLSIGYWIGGKMADREATTSGLSTLLFVNSLVCLFLYLFAGNILIFLFKLIEDTAIGTLIASFILFSIPSILFGIVSPYAAKLQLNSLENSGKTVGNLYALATVGSIVGTFITGYYLLSIVSSYLLILFVSLALLINAILLSYRKFLFLKLMAATVIIVSGIFISPSHYRFTSQQVLAVEHTQYSDYYVLEHVNENNETLRFLLTEIKSIQSGYTVGDNTNLFAMYTKFFTIPACYGANNRILMIGGGAFSYPKYVLEEFPDSTIDVVEIDPELTRIAETYFDLPQKRDRMSIINEDGRVFLNTNHKTYDTILVDAFNTYVPPFQIITQEALSKMYDSLADDGMVIMNVPSMVDESTYTLLDAELQTMKTVFNNVEVYQVRKDRELHEMQGFILIGYKGAPQMSNTCLAKEEGLLENKMELEPKQNVPLFTDSFAPVEHVIFR